MEKRNQPLNSKSQMIRSSRMSCGVLEYVYDCMCVEVYRLVAQIEEIEMETLKLNDIRWLDEEEVSKCKQCGQTRPYPTCARCKHSRVLRTIKQTLRKTWICNLQYEAITCEILEEDIDKPVKCPFFEETQFEECK